MDESPDLRMLFHRLNNQLGIILANAELLEAKTTDATNRARAAQVVASALDAMGTAREIRATRTFSKPDRKSGVRPPSDTVRPTTRQPTRRDLRIAVEIPCYRCSTSD